MNIVPGCNISAMLVAIIKRNDYFKKKPNLVIIRKLLDHYNLIYLMYLIIILSVFSLDIISSFRPSRIPASNKKNENDLISIYERF